MVRALAEGVPSNSAA